MAYVPDAQAVQELEPALALVPGAQATHAAVPPAAAVPAEQGSQTRSAMLVPACVTPEPAGQAVHLVQVLLLSTLLKLPAAQLAQERLATAEPALAT